MADWTDAAAYAPLLTADRSIFAWEWLRRDSAYRKEAERAPTIASKASSCGAAKWGLLSFERPDLPALAARPIWRAERHALVLRAYAVAGADDADSFLLSRFADFTTVVANGPTQHLLLSDGSRNIRLDVSGARFGEGPVRFHYELSGLSSLASPLAVLARLRRLVRTGRINESANRPSSRARRLILVLRAWDGLQSGANQRDIAAALLHEKATHPRWRIHAPCVRSQAQRLVHSARAMAAGGFWELLQ